LPKRAFRDLSRSSKLEVRRSAVGDLPVSFSYLLLSDSVSMACGEEEEAGSIPLYVFLSGENYNEIAD